MRKFLRGLFGTRPGRRTRRFQPQPEVLEVRQLLATFTVNNTGDTGPGSLRDAMIQANTAAGADTIVFAIPGAGVHTITPLSALPALTGPVVIDGTSQGVITTNPLIEINGTSAGASNGLVVSGGASTIRALTINRFQQIGINVTSNGNTIDGCFIGVDQSGSAAAANGLDGIQITGSGNLIGGVATAARNVISGNLRNGISFTGANANTNNVQNNVVGMNRQMTAKVSNAGAGVKIAAGAHDNIIGGVATGMRNFISGNTTFGVLIEGAGTTANGVQGNFIGNGSASATNLGNQTGVGIRSGATNNGVGSANPIGMNIISGNSGSGVAIQGTGTTGNSVFGNRIGTNSAGSAALANGVDGVLIDSGASLNSIGLTITGGGNQISGNARHGIVISGAGSSQNFVQNNLIGLNSTGLFQIANAQLGLVIQAGAANNLIGGQGNAPNTVSGNTLGGVSIRGSGTTGNTVAGNRIGLNLAGTSAVPNVLDGVIIESAATGNTIGGSVSGSGNTISGNGRAGVRISGSGTSGNSLLGNRIGTNSTGTSAVANRIGVWILSGAQSNNVGGTGGADKNLISGNSIYGISISGSGTDLNVIRNNRIGMNETETSALPNGFDGISIAAGAKNNTIGGTTTSTSNVISGNGRHGISLGGIGTTGNSVLGNRIGLNSANDPVPNSLHGVVVYAGASGNPIGNTTAGSQNVIAGNGRFGVVVTGAGSSATIQNNLIGIIATSVTRGNASGGILVSAAGTAVIGGTVASARNVISGNFGSGVVITDSGTTGVTVQGNFIGTDTTGNVQKRNNDAGVRIQQGASNVTIGGSVSGAGNVISGNNFGIQITEEATHNVTIQGNLIGTNAAGTSAIPNFTGIRLDSATQVTIGGTTSTARNVISGNIFDGITIAGNNSVGADTENVIQGNFIGLNAAGTGAIPNKDGIQISNQDRRITIGGGSSGAANFISGNSRFGIRLADANNHQILGNRIGTRADGITAQGNSSHGIFIDTNSDHNRLGGELPGEGNLIANNGGDGVLVGSDPAAGFTGAAGTGNSILGNRIFANAGQAIDLGPNDGATANDINDPDSGPNNLQNKPGLTFATSLGGSTIITGSLDSVIGTFRIEFFVGTLTGQAEEFVGATTETITDTNDATFASVFAFTITPGKFLMAVATNLETGDSSELSLGLSVL